MAEWSRERNTYLSALLDGVTGAEDVVKIRHDYCKIQDYIWSIDGKDMYYTGSRSEGLNLPGSDDDYMIDINNPFDIEVSESAHDLVQSASTNKLLIITDNVPPAFVMLKCITLQNQDLLRSTVNFGVDVYFSSLQFLSLPCWLEYESESHTKRIQGPSIEVWHEYMDTSQSGRDNVPSIRCTFWLTSAAEWKDRPRHYGWPSQNDKEYIEQFGCHLVPVGHPLSARKSLEWRLSFSIAERTLVWSFNHTQLQCYAVMKIILKEFVKANCAEKHKSVLCSYFIKTFLFWKFEKMEQSFWQKANLSECITYLLLEFYSCIQTGVLRHYFVSRFNLLEIKLTPDAQVELLKIFGKVIEAGISIIGHTKSLSRVFSNFIVITDRRHCEMRTTEIIKRRVFDSDSITIGSMDSDMIDFIRVQQDWLSLESLFTAFLRLSSDISSTSLAMFTVRHLCLLILVRKLFNFSYQSNKNLYCCMASLNKNVLGKNLSSSKLWLATFLLQRGDYDGSLQHVNGVLSSIPPYALYYSGGFRSGEYSKQLFLDRYSGRNTDILCRAKEAWLFDMHFTHSEYSFVPRAIQIGLDHCDPRIGFKISPFAFAYYLMFMCYHGLGQYDNRDRALRQLVDIANDKERRGVYRHHSNNIAGHCMLSAGNVDMARNVFLESARLTRSAKSIDKYNAAHKYLTIL